MNLVLNTIGASVNNDMIRSLLPNKKEVEIIDTTGMKIAHCMGCNQCWLKTPGICAIKDNYESILKKLVQAITFGWFPIRVLAFWTTMANERWIKSCLC